MRTFVSIYFGLGIVTAVLQLIEITFSSWPRVKEKTLGEAVGIFLLGFSFTLWAGIVLFR